MTKTTAEKGATVHPSYFHQPGKHCDGNGLFLYVTTPGQGSWVFRHKERFAGLGSASAVSISKAREVAGKLWRAAHGPVDERQDPFEVLKAMRAANAPKAPAKTFGQWLAEYLDKKEPQWSPSNRERERRDHERTFGELPEFCLLPVTDIDAKARADALDKLGKSARRKAKSWINAVIRYAQSGLVTDRSHGEDEVEHHEAMPYRDLPAFYAGLSSLDNEDARALRFTILTGARTDEVIGRKQAGKWLKRPATWGEISEVDGQAVWTIPGSTDDETNYRGMKAGRGHRVPLSPEALALLGERRADDKPLFRVSSQNAMLSTLKSNGGNGYTVHGMRSSFEDWGAEATNFPRDLVKLCTAHETKTKTDKAYQRSDLLDKRREIMTAWADFLTG